MKDARDVMASDRAIRAQNKRSNSSHLTHGHSMTHNSSPIAPTLPQTDERHLDVGGSLKRFFGR